MGGKSPRDSDLIHSCFCLGARRDPRLIAARP